MKKLLFVLLTILITFPLMGQELRLQKNYRNQLTRNSILIDTIDTKDTVYIVEYRYYENNYYNTDRTHLNGYYVGYPYYNWYDNNYLWSHNKSCPNYYKYKPRPHRQRINRTLTRIVKPVERPDDIRYRKTAEIRPRTNSRYNRPTSTYQKPTRIRYNQHNHRNVVNKPNNNVRQRNYNSNGNRNSTFNGGLITKSGTSNNSSSRSRR